MFAASVREGSPAVERETLNFRKFLVTSLYDHIVQNSLGLREVPLSQVGVRDTDLYA
jgi:hypothetical protein